ncbi:hypothetical protein ACM01_27160 [Streptomyces viridochromogenes]|uniref:DUF7224 domain-containing protein n=1 Tax=Streptomyces viridochromogenes TaxID=1938 RepID=A0A0J7Z5G6_STRVR|nr:hypothetical protein ACM01_27160 [Streptomyces viridochromogenes]KOG17172.1 hypothetical protein ADK35_25345 [Streptomyces viridochromogenes]KOG20193.1 hypothetical protein ADK36_18005 [Streptomyces viridochromogenes]
MAQLGAARAQVMVVAQALAPVALLGLAAVTGSFLTVRVSMGSALDWPSVSVIGMITVVLAAHMLLGFVVGYALPRLLAPALILVLDYLWMTLPPTFDTMWVRHLTGHLETGLPVTDRINPDSVIAPAVVAAGIAAAGLLVALTSGRRRMAAALAGVLGIGLGGLAGQHLVADWGPSAPALARTDQPACAGKKPEICVPRELASVLPELEGASAAVLPRLADAGIPAPQRLSTASTATRVGPETWRVYASPYLTEDDARAEIAEAALPDLPDCLAHTDAYVGDPLPLRVWLLLAGGVPDDVVTEHYGPDALPAMAGVRAQSEEKQLDWFRRNLNLLKQCEPSPETQAIVR